MRVETVGDYASATGAGVGRSLLLSAHLVATFLWTSGAAAHAQPAANELVTARVPEPARGRLLLAPYQCGSCHSVPGVPAARGVLAASLANYGRRSYIAGHVPNNGSTLARWIENPKALVPDTTMPDMGVSAADARDMAAYLGTLR